MAKSRVMPAGCFCLKKIGLLNTQVVQVRMSKCEVRANKTTGWTGKVIPWSLELWRNMLSFAVLNYPPGSFQFSWGLNHSLHLHECLLTHSLYMCCANIWAPSALSRPSWIHPSIQPCRSAESVAEIALTTHHSFMSSFYDSTYMLAPWKLYPDVLWACICVSEWPWLRNRKEWRKNSLVRRSILEAF